MNRGAESPDTLCLSDCKPLQQGT